MALFAVDYYSGPALFDVSAALRPAQAADPVPDGQEHSPG